MAGKAEVRWHGKIFIDMVDRRIGRRLRAVGAKVADQVRKNISTPTNAVGPSRPGEYPHLDTGDLEASVYSKSASGKVVVGATAEHAGIIEEIRPFLSRTMEEMGDEIQRDLTRPL